MFQIVELIINSSNLPEKFIIVVVAIAFSLITLSYIKQQDFLQTPCHYIQNISIEKLTK